MPVYFVYMTRFSIPRDPGLYERCRPREQTYQFDVKLKDEGIFSLNSFSFMSSPENPRVEASGSTAEHASFGYQSGDSRRNVH